MAYAGWKTSDLCPSCGGVAWKTKSRPHCHGSPHPDGEGYFCSNEENSDGKGYSTPWGKKLYFHLYKTAAEIKTLTKDYTYTPIPTASGRLSEKKPPKGDGLARSVETTDCGIKHHKSDWTDDGCPLCSVAYAKPDEEVIRQLREAASAFSFGRL